METESRRWCSCSPRHSFLLILMFAAIFFFYNIDIEEMTLDWKTIKWNPFKSLGQHVSSGSSKVTSESNEPGSPASPQQTENNNVTDMTGPTTNTSAMTQSDSAKPLPYKSPGPYFVEYPYEYHYLINEPDKCEQQKPFLVLVVPVAPANRAHRDVIRSTWGGEGLVRGKVVQLFFLLGRHNGDGAQGVHEQLQRESREHRDLIQSDFLDCYKNLTIKTMVMLEWLDSHCSQYAQYAMKIDSDMFLNVENLIDMLSTAPKTNYLTGQVESAAGVRRDRPSKWFVPVEVYAESYYPAYTLGLGYVLSLDLPKKLVAASRHVKAFYIEDVYLGMCMRHLGIRPTHPSRGGYFHVFPVPYSRCSYSRLIATTTFDNTDPVRVWKDFKRPGPYC